jgi:hypothetical protein
MLARTVRTSPATGIRIDSLLTAVLTAELVAPSPELWLVSPWISDLVVLDNAHGSFDGLFPEDPPRTCTLSQILALLARRGARLTVVTRRVEHNSQFVRSLCRLAAPADVPIVWAQDVHEKTFCGGEWILSGSMNFTVRGMAVNDEAMTYVLDGSEAARARLDLARRWRDQA